jgi:LmbE family N-acetylglucosaminyl deacetylase
MIEGKNIALIVAHPDDAELFAGGLPIRFKDRAWTIFCCSIPRRDPIRATQAIGAALTLNANLVQLNHVETDLETPFPWLDELRLDGFDTIVTHGPRGNYGHVHHIGVHDFIREKYPYKPTILFGYGEPTYTHAIILTDEELEQKWTALNCYPETVKMLVDRFFHGSKEGLRRERYVVG